MNHQPISSPIGLFFYFLFFETLAHLKPRTCCRGSGNSNGAVPALVAYLDLESTISFLLPWENRLPTLEAAPLHPCHSSIFSSGSSASAGKQPEETWGPMVSLQCSYLRQSSYGQFLAPCSLLLCPYSSRPWEFWKAQNENTSNTLSKLQGSPLTYDSVSEALLLGLGPSRMAHLMMLPLSWPMGHCDLGEPLIL